MRFGISTFITDQGIAPAALASAVAERGFDSLFVSEHSHIPISRLSPSPEGGELGEKYYRLLDPFIALSAAATVTTRLLLGTGITLLPQRDPIITAKEVASLDLLSGGRFLFGVGVGLNREEMMNHGTDPRTGGRVTEERLEAMQQIWTHDIAEYHSEFVDFGPMSAWPERLAQAHTTSASTPLHRRRTRLLPAHSPLRSELVRPQRHQPGNVGRRRQAASHHRHAYRGHRVPHRTRHQSGTRGLRRPRRRTRRAVPTDRTGSRNIAPTRRLRRPHLPPRTLTRDQWAFDREKFRPTRQRNDTPHPSPDSAPRRGCPAPGNGTHRHSHGAAGTSETQDPDSSPNTTD
jgi:probable F420-dependent oxidoreductase